MAHNQTSSASLLASRSGDPLISAHQACAVNIQRSELAVSRAGVFWLQTDPSEGFNVLWHMTDSGPKQFGPGALAVRSQVNGYGGGALAASDDGVFVVGEDQQIRFLRVPDGECTQLTNEPDAAFGGLVADVARQRVLAVREQDGRQQLVAVPLQGKVSVLHKGQDFYSAPALSVDSEQVAWTSWQLPDMPWVRSTLWTATMTEEGALRNCRSWPTPTEGSVQQPVFAGLRLYVLSDHEGWWQPWFLENNGDSVDASARRSWLPDDSPDLDHANAPWQLGESHHCVATDGSWARVRYRAGIGELWLFPPSFTEGRRIARDYSDFRYLRSFNRTLFCIARSATHLDSVLVIDMESGWVKVLAGGENPMPDTRVALPIAIEIPALRPQEINIYSFFYPPTHTAEKAPPLILVAHGGPTSAAYPVFNPQIQYWCQRGFAVAEVNYRGSSGFGRAFRLLLEGRWGDVDVEDMERTADHLNCLGLVDGQRVFMQGRSSGGYTALMAMIRSRRFTAGASLFGVTDPLRLRAMTHRFESGYLDWLLGSPDALPDRWRERTPRLHADRITAPMIFFQGGKDRVVVPEQTGEMIAAMKSAGRTPEFHLFEEEGHGFRRQSNQADMLERIYSFYCRHS